MHTVKWFQVLLSNINNSTYYQSIVCTHLNGFKYRKWLGSSIWHIDGTVTDTTTLGQSGPGSNGNEEVLYICQNSRTGTSPWNGKVLYLEHLPVVVGF